MPTTYAIPNGRTVFDATLFTGTSGNVVVSNADNGTVGFQPDFVWTKARSNAQGHTLIDSVRGASKYLQSNLTNAEGTLGLPISFNSNGFTSTTDVHTNGYTYVAWQWQAGQGTTSTNTNGSIISTVSVNATAGFSVVTYTGNDTSGATVGHGLGVAPKMIIVKERSQVRDWSVYHISTGNTGGLLLNTTGAVNNTRSGWWNNTTPSSTVITLGGSTGNDWYQTNQTGQTYVAYCWAEVAGFSQFGSYTGNGSADGPFVYTGFRPAFVMTKKSSGSGDWYMWDNKRIISANGDAGLLYAQSSLAESDYNAAGIDLLSNGFKIRNSDSSDNGSGDTMIYMAFCENPFKYSNAR